MLGASLFTRGKKMVALFYAMVGALMHEAVERGCVPNEATYCNGHAAKIVWRRSTGETCTLEVKLDGDAGVDVNDGKTLWKYTRPAQLKGLGFQYWLCGRFKS